MTKVCVALLTFFLLGCTFAQVPTIVELQVGSNSGTLVPTNTQEEAEHPQVFYKLWVPENTETLSVVFQQTDSVCTNDITYNIHADHIPCGSDWSTGSDESYPCRYAISTYFTDSTFRTVDLYPGSDTRNTLVRLGDYVYISMVRDYSSDYQYTCTFNINVTLTTCSNGEIAVNSGSGSSACKPHTTLTLPHTSAFNASAQLVESYYRLVVPENTAYIHVQVNNSGYSSYVRGNPYFAGGDYYYTCDGSYTTVDSYYVLDAWCFVPPKGYFYLYFYTYTSGYYLQGDLSIDIKTCANNEAGYNCTYQAYNLTDNNSLNGAEFTIQPYEGGSSQFSGYNDGFKAFYLNVAANSTFQYNFTTTLVAGTSSYQYFRRNGYISDNSYNYLFYNSLSVNYPEKIVISWFDTYLGGNFLFAVSNEGTTNAVNFTLSASASGTSTSTSGVVTTGSVTTGAVTTGHASTTAPVTTTGPVTTTANPTSTTANPTSGAGVTTGDAATTGSGASTVFASFALIVIALIALF